MKKFFKKNFVAKKVVALALCAATLFTMGGVNAYAAGNYKDTGFVNFTISGTTNYTSSRQKLDKTSASIKVTSASSSMVVRVYGSKTENGTKKDLTYGTPKIVKQSKTYTYLPNKLREKNYEKYVWCRLGFTKSELINFKASGLWSPDSI